MPRSYTPGQLHALIRLFGDADAVATEFDLDVDDFIELVESGRVSDDFKDDFDNDLRKWKRRNKDLAYAIENVGAVLDFHTELIQILDNDGVADALLQNSEAFSDIFLRKDPTKFYDEKKEKWYSGGGLYPGAVKVIIDYATKTKKGRGSPRKRGQANLQPMIDALKADNYEIGAIDDSEFWKWFREIYGD